MVRLRYMSVITLFFHFLNILPARMCTLNIQCPEEAGTTLSHSLQLQAEQPTNRCYIFGTSKKFVSSPKRPDRRWVQGGGGGGGGGAFHGYEATVAWSWPRCFYLLARLRMSRAVAPLPHMPSWCVQWQLYLYTTNCMGNVAIKGWTYFDPLLKLFLTNRRYGLLWKEIANPASYLRL